MPKPEPLDPSVALDLDAVDAELRGEDAYERTGHTARTLIRVSDLRVVLIAIRGGSSIAPHSAEGTTTLHVLRGHIRFRQGEKNHELMPGRLLVLERNLEHGLEAQEDSTLLLTLGWSGHKNPAGTAG